MQDSIRRGHVAVNGAVTTKTAAGVQPGDAIDLVVYEPAPIAAVPEVRCVPLSCKLLSHGRWCAIHSGLMSTVESKNNLQRHPCGV